MAIEFPEGFPFNRKSAKDEAADMIASLQHSQALSAPEEGAAIEQSQADLDFEAAIGDTASDRPIASTAIEMAQALTAPAESAPIAAKPQRLMSARGMRLAEAVAEATGPNEKKAAAPLTGRDRRRAPRQTLVAKATVRCESQAVVVASGFLSNISMSGVGFHTRKPLRVGDKYQLRVEVGPMKWASRLRVVSCMAHGDTYDVGAEFVGNELASLGRREFAA
jgi:hypothetical protein